MSSIDFMLGMAGVPQETISEIEKAAPTAAALLKLLKDNDALIRKIVAVVGEAEPLIAQAAPLVNQALAEVRAIMPAAQDVIAFIQNKQAAVDPSTLS